MTRGGKVVTSAIAVAVMIVAIITTAALLNRPDDWTPADNGYQCRQEVSNAECQDWIIPHHDTMFQKIFNWIMVIIMFGLIYKLGKYTYHNTNENWPFNSGLKEKEK